MLLQFAQSQRRPARAARFSALDYGRILDRAAAKGMGAFVIRVLAAGALTSDPSTGGGGSGQTLSPGSDYPLDLQRAEKVKAALGVDGKNLTQAAIRFGLMNQKVSTVLVGFSNATHIDEAVACSGAPGLSEEQMAKMKRLWETDFSLSNSSSRRGLSWRFFFTPMMSIN